MSDYIKQLEDIKDWWYNEKNSRHQQVQELRGQKRDLNQRMDQISTEISGYEQSIAREERVFQEARRARTGRGNRGTVNAVIGDYKRMIRNAKAERRDLAAQRRNLDSSIRDWQASFDEAKREFKQAKQNYDTVMYGTGEVGGGRKSTNPVHGLTADGQPVTLAEGLGDKAGHIYLRDGHAENGQFWGSTGNKHHDHYDGQGGGSERGKYTGQGS